MIDYLNDINNTDLKEFAEKMYNELIKELAWYDYDEENEEETIQNIYDSLVELQKLIKQDNNIKLGALYYYIVQKYLE